MASRPAGVVAGTPAVAGGPPLPWKASRTRQATRAAQPDRIRSAARERRRPRLMVGTRRERLRSRLAGRMPTSTPLRCRRRCPPGMRIAALQDRGWQVAIKAYFRIAMQARGSVARDLAAVDVHDLAGDVRR